MHTFTAADPERLASTRDCLCANLRKASRAVSRLYDGAIRETGLQRTQFTLLSHVVQASGRPLGDLADLLGMDRTTLTRGLKPLQDAGWVRVEPGADARVRRVETTSAGRAKVAEALPHWARAQKALVEALGGPDAADRLVESLRRVARRAEDL